MKKIVMMCAAMVAAGQMLAGEVTATAITAKQRYPWNGLVDITLTLQGASNDVAAAICIFVATNKASGATVAIKTISNNGDIAGSNTTWTRKLIWDARSDLGEVQFDAVEITTAEFYTGVQLWENGPYWAECNVGASKPEEYGYYFWWGDTVGYKRNSSNNGWVSVKDGASYSFNSCPTYGMSYSSLQSSGYIDAAGNLTAAHDAATVHLGSPWRMPTDAEHSALINNCTTTWTTRNGVYGRLVTGKGAYASKSIFLPAAGYGYASFLRYTGSYGYCWSSSPYSDDSYFAWSLYFYSGNFYWNDGYRCYGQSVRPVRGFAQ